LYTELNLASTVEVQENFYDKYFEVAEIAARFYNFRLKESDF